MTQWNRLRNISAARFVRKLPLVPRKYYLINRLNETIGAHSSKTCIRGDWRLLKRVNDFMKIFKKLLRKRLFHRHLIYLQSDLRELILSIL